MYEFNIRTVLPTLNEYVNAERSNRFIAAAMKKEFTETCSKCALQMPKLPEQYRYDIEVFWTLPNAKKDPDNVFFGIKFILDGVVAAGKIKNDGMKQFRNIHHRPLVVKDKYEVVIRFNPIMGD